MKYVLMLIRSTCEVRRLIPSLTRWLLLLALLLSAARSIGASNPFVIAQQIGNESYAQAEKGKQATPRDDRAFATLWLSLHDCKTEVYVANGEISSEYMRGRGYVGDEASQKGYLSISVDERFEGLKVTTILLPTTWAIIALTVDAPVETVKRRLEETRNIRFARKANRHFFRDLKNQRFEIFPERDHSSRTVIQCDSEQQ